MAGSKPLVERHVNGTTGDHIRYRVGRNSGARSSRSANTFIIHAHLLAVFGAVRARRLQMSGDIAEQAASVRP
jgi:hypothetical protein